MIFSHSDARALADHPRNVPDDILQALPANGGVVMVNFYLGHLSEPYRQWAAEESAEDGAARRPLHRPARHPESEARRVGEGASGARRPTSA